MDKALDHAECENAIILSDMTRCQPAEAVDKERKRYHWHAIAYEAEGLSGTMIGASSRMEAPTVTLPLGVTGWHAVYVGIWNPHYAYDGDMLVKVKLTDDPCFQPIWEPEPVLTWPGTVELKEAFFKYADLTGEDLLIAQQSKGNTHKAFVAYVKLVPLSGQEVEAIEKDRARTDTRNLTALNDGNGLFYDAPTTPAELLEEVEQYRYSDVGVLLFAASSGDVVNYPSKITQPWLAGTGDAVTNERFLLLRDSVKALLDKKIVPIEVFADHLHPMGIDVHAMFRMGIIGDIPPSDLWHAENGLVGRRPDLRMIDRDGTPIEKASYALPEVREFMLSLMREVAEWYDIDGINLGWSRGPQFVGYEDVVVKDFMEEYGQDPRDLDEHDYRLERHRAGYLTEFTRQARQMVDEVGRKKGKKIELSAMGYTANVAQNLFYGYDILTWITEDLLDTILLSCPVEAVVLEAIRTHKCKLTTHLMPCSPEATAAPPETARMAQLGYETGVDGFWYWDMNGKQTKPEHWEILRQVGDREQMDAFVKKLPKMKTIPVKTVAGFDVCHTTNRGAARKGYFPPEMLSNYSGG